MPLGATPAYLRRARAVAEAEGITLVGHEFAMQRIGAARLAPASTVLGSLALRLMPAPAAMTGKHRDDLGAHRGSLIDTT